MKPWSKVYEATARQSWSLEQAILLMQRSRELASCRESLNSIINQMNHPREILIYGFKPYLNYAQNVTENVIQEINDRKLGRGIVFDVEFDRNMFAKALRKHHPKLVIGLGQHPRARKIRIERRARNWQKAAHQKGSQIDKAGPEYQYVSLKLPDGEQTTVTYDAGSYVCNFSMYIMNGEAKKVGAKYAFLHVPRTADPGRTATLIEGYINVCAP
jgi:pyroglutamyl-peptidase